MPPPEGGGEHSARAVKHARRRAVVVVERDDARLHAHRAREGGQVGAVRLPPRVDALVRVAHRHQVAVDGRHSADKLALTRRRVLELVHPDVPPAGRVLGARGLRGPRSPSLSFDRLLRRCPLTARACSRPREQRGYLVQRRRMRLQRRRRRLRRRRRRSPPSRLRRHAPARASGVFASRVLWRCARPCVPPF